MLSFSRLTKFSAILLLIAGFFLTLSIVSDIVEPIRITFMGRNIFVLQPSILPTVYNRMVAKL